MDRPRWNHDLGTLASDHSRAERGLDPKWVGYLAAPCIFYVLFDRSPREPDRLRVRAWCIEPERDTGWRDLFERFIAARSAAQYNLQLHPPIGRDDDLVVNTLGNLDFAGAKVFEAVFDASSEGAFTVDWVLEPSDAYKAGTTEALPYARDRERRIEIEGASGHVLGDEQAVRALFRSLAEE